METKSMTFIAACKDFFGLLPGQTLSQFLAETKALTEKDRAELSAMLAANGYTLTTAQP